MIRENSENALSLSGENNLEIDLDHFDIVHVFGKEKLEEIQESISKVTSLAFVTVDFKGEPVTKPTFFTEFCECVRKNPALERNCRSSDAYGAIQATIAQKPSIYFCPCGLLEVAIPIIVQGHYLGGFIGGQIMCTDAPRQVARLESVLGISEEISQTGVDVSLKNEAPVMSYEKFCNVADLAFMIINQMTENELAKLERQKTNRGKINELKEENERLKFKGRLKDAKISALKYSQSPHFMINTISSIANLAVIEDAPETNEALIMLADYIKSVLVVHEDFWSMTDELDNVERYFKIQKLRLQERLDYRIEIPEKMRMQRVPSQILSAFVQQAVEHGIVMNETGGTVKVCGFYENNDVIIFIEDNGPGMSNDKIDSSYGKYDTGTDDGILKSTEAASKRIRLLFGNDYDVVTELTEGEGRKVCVRFPKYFDERDEEDVSDFDRG